MSAIAFSRIFTGSPRSRAGVDHDGVRGQREHVVARGDPHRRRVEELGAAGDHRYRVDGVQHAEVRAAQLGGELADGLDGDPVLLAGGGRGAVLGVVHE